ncbi:MAG: hypothetical protein Q9198_003546, partial [Flavoplaca austrocitrina]
MLDSTQNLSKVCQVFRKFVQQIRKKNTAKDPNFLQISIACGKVEQFIETIFPSQNPESVVRQKPPETEAEKKERLEARWDI